MAQVLLVLATTLVNFLVLVHPPADSAQVNVGGTGDNSLNLDCFPAKAILILFHRRGTPNATHSTEPPT